MILIDSFDGNVPAFYDTFHVSVSLSCHNFLNSCLEALADVVVGWWSLELKKDNNNNKKKVSTLA